ncbi:hypothetical protein, partial [Nocardia farcinica]
MSGVLNSGGWSSDAARKAGTAVTTYTRGIDAMRDSMHLLSLSLLDASGWVEQTRWCMPDDQRLKELNAGSDE